CPVTAPVAGREITFTAPDSGASGTFASTGTNSVTVGANGSGAAAAPQFTANRVAGTYSVVATSIYGQVIFTLTNTATGVVESVAAAGPTRQSATAGARYAPPFSGKRRGVGGRTVTFGLGQAEAGGAGGGDAPGAGASFDGGGTQSTAVTDDSGAASSPTVTANATAGTFTASASVQGVAQPLVFRL